MLLLFSKWSVINFDQDCVAWKMPIGKLPTTISDSITLTVPVKDVVQFY